MKLNEIDMNIYKKFIEQVILIGPSDEIGKALDYCLVNGYRVIRSGPKPVAKYRVDPDKFKVVGQREAT